MGCFRFVVRVFVVILAVIFFSGCAGVKTDKVPHKQDQTKQELPKQELQKQELQITAGEYTKEIESGGQLRTYLLYVPIGYDGAKPLPLVLNFHGTGGSPDSQMSVSDLGRMADKKTFIVAAPVGLYINKSMGRKNWNTTRDPDGVNDIEFIRNLIKKISSSLHIDPKRIYATGFSGGGRMSSRLACDLSDIIAAIGPVSGLQCPDNCLPVRPVPVITFHGIKDNINHYFHQKNSRAYWKKGVEDAVAGWVEKNSCNKTPVIEKVSKNVSKIIYGGCKGKANVVFYRIAGAGHTWPDSPVGDILESYGFGKTNRDINASELIWSFFMEHPLP